MEEVTFGKAQTAADAKLTEVDEIAAEIGSELVITAQIEIAGVPDISGVLVLTVSMAVSFLFSGRIREMDMVEILKGTE